MRGHSLLRRGALAAGAMAMAVGGGALVLGASPAGASSKEMTAAGSFTTYVLMHNLFPTSLDDLNPGQDTQYQKTTATPALCTGGLTWAATPSTPAGHTRLAGTTFTFTTGATTTTRGTPNGSTNGRAFLAHEENTAHKAAHTQGCVDFARSSAPPKPSGTKSANFDYYAYALTGASVIVGSNSINGTTGTATKAVPPTINLGQMRALYGCKTATETWKEAGIGTSNTKINTFIPQPGSGTRTVTKSILGFTPVTTIGKKPGLDTCTAADVAVQKFPHANHATAPNEENSEEGMLWANSLTHSTPTWKTLKNDLEMVYAAGKYSNEYNTPTNYNATHTNSIGVPGNTIGNFVRTHTTGIGGRKLLYAAWQKYKYTAPTTVGTAEPLVVYNATHVTHPTGTFSIDPVTVKESNEWFSNIPTGVSTTTASHSTVPGVRYVFNVADTVLPTYNGAKMMIGFDNKATGVKSELCHGDLSTAITASGFLGLGTTAPSNAGTSSDLANANCREFPGGAYPGHASAPITWTSSHWVNPTA